MFAIVEIGPGQEKVSAGDILDIPRTQKKKEIIIDKVLMVISGEDVEIGFPYVKGAKVVCDIIGDKKGEKKIAYKYKRRKSYHRKVGHRDLLTRVKVKEIKTA
ncbi:MAG: 50S ribosomal protein L21 [Candidatus Omnitrophota bacterium]|jgi:large subunit ribosomal protein L21